MPRFLFASDLQLGVGADLGREPGERLAEQQQVWAKIVQTANDLDVPLVFAGDAWERRRSTPAELIAFWQPLDDALHEPLLIVGNHDVEAFDRPTGYDVRGGRPVHVSRPEIRCVGGAVFACLPWAPPGRLVALDGGGDRDELNARLAAGLVEIARGLHAEAHASKRDLPVVLLGHWHVSSATTSSGRGAGEIFREPLLDYAELDRIGFDLIALGHNHRPQMLSDRGFHVGSPMPCNFGEAAHEHCVWLVDVEAGAPPQCFRIPVESRRLVTLDIEGPRDAVASLDDVDGAIVKVRIRASEKEARRLDLDAYRRQLLDAGAHKVWALQVDVDRGDHVRGPTLAEDLSDVEALEQWLALAGVDEAKARELLDLGAGYLERTAG